MRLTAAGRSATGPRPANEDADFVDLNLGLFIVADGMGGHRAGEVASRIAVDSVVQFIRETHNGGDITWPFARDPKQSSAANRIAVALRLANKEVHEASTRDPRYSGMGTTLVTVLVDRETIIVGHVGDSRAYCRRGTDLKQMTEDDTWLNVMRAAGASKAAQHPMRHVLTRGIGLRPQVTPSVAESRLVTGERWLLCTDGVHNALDLAALSRALDAPSPEGAANQTVESALAAGTTDNATAVVVYVE